jgi:hypothetical protein
MIAKVPKRVEMDLDKPRSFYYDMRTAAAFEDKMGKVPVKLDWNSPKELCTMVHLILQRTDASLTYDQVLEMVHGQNLDEVRTAVADCMGVELVKQKKSADGAEVIKPEEPAKN